MAIEVTDVPERARYELTVDGARAGHENYLLEGSSITLTHTRVYDEYLGRGLAAELVTAVLSDIRTRGLRLSIECPYVETFIARKPGEYSDLLE